MRSLLLGRARPNMNAHGRRQVAGSGRGLGRQALGCEIALERGAPQLRRRADLMAGQPLRRGIIMKRAFAAGRLEGGKIRAAVRQRIERVVVAVEPDRRLAVDRAASEQVLVDGTRTPATRPKPAANEVDDGARRAGLAADGHLAAIDERLRQDRRRDGVDVAERTVGAGERNRFLASVALGAAERGETLVVKTLRAAAAAP